MGRRGSHHPTAQRMAPRLQRCFSALHDGEALGPGNLRRDALRPPFMAVMDLLADPVTVAGAVSLDVEVPVSGVRRIRTGPQDGREPTACSGSQVGRNSHFPRVLGFSNRKYFAVREFKTANIPGQATRMGAELATN